MVDEINPIIKQQLAQLAEKNQVTVDEMLQRLLTQHQTSTVSESKTLLDDVMDAIPDTEQQYATVLRYRGLFEQSNDAVFLIDLNGRHIASNRRASELLGYTKEELIALTFNDVVRADEIYKTRNTAKRLIAGERVPPYQRIFIHRDGTEIPAEVNVECIFNEQGKPLYFQSIVRDIRDRLIMEQHIWESEEQHRAVLETMGEGVVIYEASGDVTLMNPATAVLLGLSIDQLQGHTPIDPKWYTIHEDGTVIKKEAYPVNVTLSQAIPQYNVIIGVHKPDGSLTWLSVTSVPIFHDNGDLYRAVVTFSDITEIKYAEKQSINLAVQRERVNVISKFIESASHEFRTPLSIIQTNRYLIGRKHPNLLGLSEHLNKIDAQVNRIDRLVKRLLIMAYLDATMEPQFTINLHLELLIREVANQYNERFQAENIALDLRIDEDVTHIKSHKNYLAQALQAILDNAITHSPPDSTISIVLNKDTDWATLSIIDEGSGIAEDDFPFIFNRFWRADVAHSQEGFGLGLPIAQRIIQLHGGTIVIESELDTGTTVHVKLPILNEQVSNRHTSFAL